MAIQIKNISKSYNEVKAIDGISLTLKKGEVVGFLGPNGAGKSTLMKILTAYLKEFEGEAFIKGISVREHPIEVQKHIGYLAEHNPLYLRMYVREYLEFNRSIYKTPKKNITEVIKKVGLTNHAEKKIKALSKGYRQRLGLAAAILHQPDVLILDEPTTGLDPNQLVEIRELIKGVGQHKTVFFSTHILQEVEAICNRVIIIHRGKIVFDQAISKLQDPEQQLVEVRFNTPLNKKTLKSLPYLTFAGTKDDLTWQLRFKAKEDMRTKVFDLAQEQGAKILDLSRRNKDLEQVFQELTQT